MPILQFFKEISFNKNWHIGNDLLDSNNYLVIIFEPITPHSQAIVPLVHYHRAQKSQIQFSLKLKQSLSGKYLLFIGRVLPVVRQRVYWQWTAAREHRRLRAR